MLRRKSEILDDKKNGTIYNANVTIRTKNYHDCLTFIAQVHNKLHIIFTREGRVIVTTNAKTNITYSLAYIHVPEAYSTLYTHYYYTIPIALCIEQTRRCIL